MMKRQSILISAIFCLFLGGFLLAFYCFHPAPFLKQKTGFLHNGRASLQLIFSQENTANRWSIISPINFRSATSGWRFSPALPSLPAFGNSTVSISAATR